MGNSHTREDVIDKARRQDEIVVEAGHYLALLKDSYMLRCLEGAGVDNWDGFDYAQDMYRNEWPE